MDMKTLLERIDWVLSHRNWTQLGWSKRAGLSTRYLSTLRGRLETKPEGRGDHDAMVKLATVAGVPVAWLEDGKGDPGNLDLGPEFQREPLAELVPDDDESPAEAALLRVLDVARHTLADLDAARAALRSVDRATRADALPEAMAAAWLDAAAILRRRGVPATPRAITEQVAVGSLPKRPREVSADAEGDAKARELGVEPGSAAGAVEALLKRK